jgi:hypothetical protein
MPLRSRPPPTCSFCKEPSPVGKQISSTRRQSSSTST